MHIKLLILNFILFSSVRANNAAQGLLKPQSAITTKSSALKTFKALSKSAIGGLAIAIAAAFAYYGVFEDGEFYDGAGIETAFPFLGACFIAALSGAITCYHGVSELRSTR